MSEQDRDKWNARYDDGAYADRDRPSELLTNWIDRIDAGRALDIACGTGRNARYLARRGFRVDALDIAASGLARGRELARSEGLSVNWIEGIAWWNCLSKASMLRYQWRNRFVQFTPVSMVTSMKLMSMMWLNLSSDYWNSCETRNLKSWMRLATTERYVTKTN